MLSGDSSDLYICMLEWNCVGMNHRHRKVKNIWGGGGGGGQDLEYGGGPNSQQAHDMVTTSY